MPKFESREQYEIWKEEVIKRNAEKRLQDEKKPYGGIDKELNIFVAVFLIVGGFIGFIIGGGSWIIPGGIIGGILSVILFRSFLSEDKRKKLDEYFKTLKGKNSDSLKLPAITETAQIRDIDSLSFAKVGVNAPNDDLRCPECGSTQLNGEKRGFGWIKSSVGIVFAPFGPGVLAGFIGSRKIQVTCLRCGHHWIAGKRK